MTLPREQSSIGRVMQKQQAFGQLESGHENSTLATAGRSGPMSTRGGGELGYDWYEGGKFLKKRNTFTDFIDCAHHLIKVRCADCLVLCLFVSTHGVCSECHI
jgi:Prolyl oligopeptidase family